MAAAPLTQAGTTSEVSKGSTGSIPKENASAAAPLCGEGPVHIRPETGCQQKCSHVDPSKVLILRHSDCLSLCTICRTPGVVVRLFGSCITALLLSCVWRCGLVSQGHHASVTRSNCRCYAIVSQSVQRKLTCSTLAGIHLSFSSCTLATRAV